MIPKVQTNPPTTLNRNRLSVEKINESSIRCPIGIISNQNSKINNMKTQNFLNSNPNIFIVDETNLFSPKEMLDLTKGDLFINKRKNSSEMINDIPNLVPNIKSLLKKRETKYKSKENLFPNLKLNSLQVNKNFTTTDSSIEFEESPEPLSKEIKTN